MSESALRRNTPILEKAPMVAAAALFMLTAPAAARSIVVQSSGPSAAQHRPGQILREPLKLTLVAGDQVTVLDDEGTRVMRGPASIDDAKPRRAPSGRVLSWSDFVDGRTVRTAAVRGDNPPKRPAPSGRSDIWQVDAAVPGHWCAANLRTLRFWRGKANDAAKMTVTSQGVRTELLWAKGQSEADWPDAVPPRDKGSYAIKMGGKKASTIILHQLDETSSLEALADQLANRECYQQLSLVLDE
jgi:hypothetical protein